MQEEAELRKEYKERLRAHEAAVQKQLNEMASEYMAKRQEVLKGGLQNRSLILAKMKEEYEKIKEKNKTALCTVIPEYRPPDAEGPNRFHDVLTCMTESSVTVEEVVEPTISGALLDQSIDVALGVVLSLTQGTELAIPEPKTHKRLMNSRAAEQRVAKAARVVPPPPKAAKGSPKGSPKGGPKGGEEEGSSEN